MLISLGTFSGKRKHELKSFFFFFCSTQVPGQLDLDTRIMRSSYNIPSFEIIDLTHESN